MVDLAAQLAVFGVANGVGYAVAALGLTLIFGVMRVVNFAHGEFFMLGAFLTATLVVSAGVPYLLALPLAAFAVLVLGAFSERLALSPLYGRPPLTLLLSTLGISLVLLNAAELIWGASPRPVPSPLEQEILIIGPVFMTWQRVFIVVGGALIVLGLTLFLKFTTAGKLIRATAQDPEGAALIGVNVGAVRSLTFGLCCGLAGLSGGLLGATVMAYPFMGQGLAIKAFAVTILGGLGSVPGAVAGGLILGVIEAIAGGMLSTEYKDLFGYAVIITVLLVRPGGLANVKH